MRILTLMILLLAAVAGVPARAAIRPSFALEYSAWHASDIVLASEGEKIDGELRVLEVWKGELKEGESISVSALAKFAPAAMRRVAEDGWRPPEANARVIEGATLVLFLKRSPEDAVIWQPASFGADLDTSVVWWEANQVFGFVQVMNPGPSLLIPFKSSPIEWKQRLDEVTRRQEALNEVIGIENPARRAWRLGAFANSQSYEARKIAYAELAKSGRAALPVLRAIIEQGEKPPLPNGTIWSLFASPGDAITTLAKAGGESVGPELTVIVRDETRFWKQVAPTLKKGWWSGTGVEHEKVEMLRQRHSKLGSALRALQSLRYQNSAQPVAELRDFWRSLPQLEDLSQMSEICDAVLKSLK